MPIDFLQEEINKVVLQLDKFRSLKLNLLSPDVAQPHKANEIVSIYFACYVIATQSHTIMSFYTNDHVSITKFLLRP